MVALFSIIVAVVLLGVTVYGLHRYQTMEVEYNVDRSMPLPPLDSQKDSSGAESPPQEGEEEEAVRAGGRERGASNPDQAAPAPARPSRKSIMQNNWLEQTAALKREGDLQAAMELCESEFPLWGAYNQACIILRGRLKQSAAGSEQESALLNQLYHLAAVAELLHDKTESSETLNLGQLKRLPLQEVARLDFPYAQIGYAHLRLIRKSDIKLMQARWGRPESHSLPRAYHQDWWQEFVSRQL